ncbi:unnamed protein product [Pleuronectes platessa]|uniref:non-specific serine/threonine protein kinase n=1 Tax=Pleuronectes platessa TaxID=8262 RepID=A0A9N7TR93_PLEPL|nr:unnamed protein product [Pleuronectes platessa]
MHVNAGYEGRHPGLPDNHIEWSGGIKRVAVDEALEWSYSCGSIPVSAICMLRCARHELNKQRTSGPSALFLQPAGSYVQKTQATMSREVLSPNPILASNRPVIKAKRRATKRKATSENEPPLQRQRDGEGPDASTNSGQPTLESVPKVNSSTHESTVLSGNTSRADFVAKYVELEQLGQGGFGTVCAGNRRSDDLPVAIKHIVKSDAPRQRVMINGRSRMIPKEVLLMQKAAGEPVTVGRSAAVSILDWYDLKHEVLLVMERPVASTDLLHLLNNNCGPLDENHAQIIMKQLVDAAIDLQAKDVFHRDLKLANILIEPSTDGPRVRIIDFGCGYIRRKNCVYSQFTGTLAYAPPEFLMKGRYMAGPTTVWELAAILIEMLTGSAWFHTKNFIGTDFKICLNSPIPNLAISKPSIANSPIPNSPIPNITICKPSIPNSPISNSPIPNITMCKQSIPNSPIPNLAMSKPSIPNYPIPNITICKPSIPNSPIPTPPSPISPYAKHPSPTPLSPTSHFPNHLSPTQPFICILQHVMYFLVVVLPDCELL